MKQLSSEIYYEQQNDTSFDGDPLISFHEQRSLLLHHKKILCKIHRHLIQLHLSFNEEVCEIKTLVMRKMFSL